MEIVTGSDDVDAIILPTPADRSRAPTASRRRHDAVTDDDDMIANGGVAWAPRLIKSGADLRGVK